MYFMPKPGFKLIEKVAAKMDQKSYPSMFY